MVTPFAWSQPHPVNDHVAGAAAELQRRGHEVVVLAPSGRATDLAAGRRALKQLGRKGTPLENVVALGPAIPISRKSRLGVPIGVRANLELALSRDRFDVIHGHEPGLPSLSYLALRDARGSGGGHVPLARTARLSAGKEAARAAAGAPGCADGRERGGGSGGSRSVPGRLHASASRRRPGALPAREASPPLRPRMAARGAPAPARSLPSACGPARLGSARPAHDVALRAPLRPARAARSGNGPHRARRPRSRRRAGRSGRPRARGKGERAPGARGGRLRRDGGRPTRRGRPARARRRRARASRRGRGVAGPKRRDGQERGREARLRHSSPKSSSGPTPAS